MKRCTARETTLLALGLGVVLVSFAQLHLGLQTPPFPPSTLLHSTSQSYKMSYSRAEIIPQNISAHGGGLVHIGKTGGSTLSLLLRNGCHSFMRHPCYNISNESPASRLIEKYYHVPDFGLLRESQHDFYVITARDPLDRAVSAFVYDHIRNRDARNETMDPMQRERYEAAYVCFPTLEVFAAYLKGNSSDFHYPYHRKEVHPESCRDLARAAFHGHVRIYSHLYFSLERIRSFIPEIKNRVFFLIRQERLWDDWIQTNRILQDTYGLSSQDSSYDVPVEAREDRRNSTNLEINNRLPVGKTLSSLATKSLCRALETEYTVFFWFLLIANNIDNEEFMFSLNKAKESCGRYLNMDEMIRKESISIREVFEHGVRVRK